MFTRVSYSANPISNTVTHNSYQSIHHSKSSFGVLHNNCIIKISRNRLLQLHCIRSFANDINKQSRTHNPGVPQMFRKYGFNAHPAKIAGCGILGGFCGALCGVGGGIVMIPLLRHITSMTAHQIAGTSLVAVSVGAISATLNYQYSSDVTRFPIALNIALCSIAFSVLGARLNAAIGGKTLSTITSICLMCCIPLILQKFDPTIPPPGQGKNRDDMSDIIKRHIEEEQFFYNYPMDWYKQNWHFPAIGCLSGFLSGLIGIGGGVVMTASMAAATDLSQHEAVATSLLCIGPTALVGSLAHYRLNHVVTPIAIILGASCALGMAVSPHIALEIKDAHLKLAFCSLLFASSLRMLYVTWLV